MSKRLSISSYFLQHTVAKPIFSRTLLRYVRLMAQMRRPSVCLSSVTLLHPRQRVELFGTIFALPSSSVIRTACIKILGRNSKGFYRRSCKLNTRGMENWHFRTISRLISKTVQDTVIVTLEDETNRNSYAINIWLYMGNGTR